MNSENNQQSTVNEINEVSEDKKKIKKSKDSEFNGSQILETPNRTLPALVQVLLKKNMHVILTNNGYYLSGFYGLNRDKENGYIFFQETTDPDLLAFYDSKNNKHAVRTFEDVVTLNALIWGQYFKLSEEYKKPDQIWFPYMIEYGVLNITPPTK